MVGGSPAGEGAPAPRFCPWCGAASRYHAEAWKPRWQALAEEKGSRPPQVISETLETDAFVTGCEACRHVSHVIGHEAKPAGR